MNWNAQSSPRATDFSHVIGVGGIGTGTIIELNGDETLGRTESRMGRLLDARDYCKLHIVEHYVAILSGVKGDSSSCRVVAIGNVGRDDAGMGLIREMTDAGIDTCYVRVEPRYRTLFSVSFLYPDKSGGNITISNSAAGELDQAQLDHCQRELAAAGSRAIALCLPEVPLKARSEFLRIASDSGSYRVASFPAGEMEAVRSLNLLSRVDLLDLNREEAAALGGADRGEEEEQVLEAGLRVAAAANPGIRLIVSEGPEGLDVFDQGTWSHYDAIPAEVISSAGAGDALLGGVIAGMVLGFPLVGTTQENDGRKRNPSAIDLGLLVAAFSLTSPHTIHPGFTLQALQEFAFNANHPLVDEQGSRLHAGSAGPGESHAEQADRVGEEHSPQHCRGV
ncbi:MAG: PfkB family carbohydrate kinase [Silvibacterium sp.]